MRAISAASSTTAGRIVIPSSLFKAPAQRRIDLAVPAIVDVAVASLAHQPLHASCQVLLAAWIARRDQVEENGGQIDGLPALPAEPVEVQVEPAAVWTPVALDCEQRVQQGVDALRPFQSPSQLVAATL